MRIFKVDPERVNKEKCALGEERTHIFPPVNMILIVGQNILLPGNVCESCLYSLNCRKDTEYNGRQSEREMGVLIGVFIGLLKHTFTEKVYFESLLFDQCYFVPL